MFINQKALRKICILILITLFLTLTNTYAQNTSDEAIKRAIEYMKKNKYDEAISEFDKVINISPNLESAYYKRGLVYWKKGNYDQALSDLNKAIEINPKNPYVYVARADIYSRKNDYDKAWDNVHKAESLGLSQFPPGFLEKLKKSSGREK